MGMSIVGYGERLSVAAGEAMSFFVSSKGTRYRAELVRLIHGDKNPAGPGYISESVSSNIDGEYDGEEQFIRPGSYAVIPASPIFDGGDSFAVALWFWRGDGRGSRQSLASRGAGDAGWCVGLSSAGRLEFRIDGAIAALEDLDVPPKTWCHVVARFDARARELSLSASVQAWPCTMRKASTKAKGRAGAEARGAAIVFAAREAPDGGVVEHFNGKIENPSIFGLPVTDREVAALQDGASPASIPGVLCAWDFARGPATDKIVDTTWARCDGRLFNLPARGMKGHNWTGSEHDFRNAPEQYGAIHFHDDDLGDANWKPSFRLNVPSDLRSGVYAVRLTNEEGEDHIPFVVTPPRGRARAEILFLAPTMSYLAYGNEAIANRPDIKQMLNQAGITGQSGYPAQQEDQYIVENRLLSCYDIHGDGSGVCYSSHKRPILSMRPSYLMPLLGLQERPGGGAHQLPSDLYITHWLEAKGYSYDVATDHELHEQGEALLSRYKVVITGSHPEYCTRQMLDGLQGYLIAGGRLMYCGGNGFFIVTSLTPDGAAIETRRMRTNRAWSSEAGEEYHNTTGEMGGAWALNGRPGNVLVGVSTGSVGFTSGVGYVKTDKASDPRVAFMFEGVDDEPIGAYQNLIYGSGAAGWEVDRAEVGLGTPSHAIVAATARLADDSYQQILHELEAPGFHASGTVNAANRADMTYLEYPNGGAVWTPGSILWCGALYHANFDNSVSRITENVLRKFLA